MIARLQRRQHRGGDGGHAGRGRAAGFGALELDYALLEHPDRRVGIARVDVAGVLALEPRLAQLGGFVDVALGEKQPFRRLAELRAQRAGMHQAGFGAIAGGGLKLRHVTSKVTTEMATKNRPGKTPRAGITLSPACLATCLTWLQAGRLKSPRDKRC